MIDSWLGRRSPKPNALHRMLLFPYAGGGASLFHSWLNAFGSAVDVLPVHLPGREGRFRELAFTRLDSLADELTEALLLLPEQLTVLFGWSMGARIAHAVARRLEQAGRPPLLLIAAAHPAPQFTHCRDPIHGLPAALFWEGVAKLGGVPAELLADRGFREFTEPTLRADFELIETCPAIEPQSISCPVAVIAADDDRLVEQSLFEAWAAATSGPAMSLTVPGGHFVVRDNPAVVTAAVDAAIVWASRLRSSGLIPASRSRSVG